MERTPPCPDREVLQRYLLGQVSEPEARALERHLAGCRHCLDTVAALQPEDALIADMRAQACGLAEPPSDVIVHMMDRFGRLQVRGRLPPGIGGGESSDTTAEATPERADATQEVFGFL